MRLGLSGQPAHISLIRRRRRLILRCASPPSGTLLKRGDPIRRRIRLTVGPSISVSGAICLIPQLRVREPQLQPDLGVVVDERFLVRNRLRLTVEQITGG
jgi:hypothetical protein